MSKDEQNEENTISREEYIDNQLRHLKEPVQPENGLKELVVNYVGNKLNPENDEVNIMMILEVFAEEFKEFLLPVAEENFIRGYQQAMSDVDDPSFIEKMASMASNESNG